MMNKTKILAGIAYIITFVLGGISGYMIAPVDEGPAESRQVEQKDSRDHDKSKKSYERFKKKMKSDLDITGQQEEDFFEIIRENRSQNREIVNQHRENMKEELHDSYHEFIDELSGVLNEDQLEKFKEQYARDALRSGQNGGRRSSGRNGRGRN